MDTKATHTLAKIIGVIILLAVILFSFAFGIWVGQERARFSFRWAENYHRNFGGPMHGFFSNFPDRDFINGHGVFGQVIKTDTVSLVMKDKDNAEKVITVTSATSIVKGFAKATFSDIKTGDTIVVIGQPDSQGNIQAELIRILPPAQPTPSSMMEESSELQAS